MKIKSLKSFRNDNVVGLFSKLYVEDPNLMDIKFCITRKCNFDCFYCDAHDNRLSNPSYESLCKIIDFLVNLKNKNFHLNIIGGEPTVHPDLFRIIKYFLDNMEEERLNKTVISLATNFSKPKQYYQDLVSLSENYPLQDFGFFASYHKEFISIDRFVDIYRWALEKDRIRIGSFMIHSKECLDLYGQVKELKKLRAAPIRGREYIADFVNINDFFNVWKDLVVIKKNNDGFLFEDVDYLDDYTFKNFVCFATKHRLVINSNGNLHFCGNRQSEKSIGNIFEGNVKLKEYTICPNKLCDCDIGIPKVSLRYFSSLRDLGKIYERSK